MKRDHVENEVGPWAKRKLKALEAYLNFYATALSKQSFKRVYIDAFAGSCVSRIRQADETGESSFFAYVDDEDSKAQDEFVLGSPIRALRVPHPFHRYHFFDLDRSRVDTLRQLKRQYNHAISVEIGDSNPLIRNLAAGLHGREVRGVAFLDPYGAHLEWATVEALAATKNFEVIINFPIAMAINRLITKSGQVPPNSRKQLTACFGTDEWDNLAYNVTTDLFGDQVKTKNEGVADRLLELYMSRLRKLFPHVATPHLIRNTRNAPLYYLIWAGPNKLGLKGANYILSQGERVAQPKRRK